jgi:hypothetical protein
VYLNKDLLVVVGMVVVVVVVVEDDVVAGVVLVVDVVLIFLGEGSATGATTTIRGTFASLGFSTFR